VTSLGAPIAAVVGGRVVGPSGTVTAGDVIVADGSIQRIGSPGSNDVAGAELVLDVDGMFVAPGLIDVQINGGWGHDFTADPASILAVAKRLPSTGVTAFLPTIVTTTAPRRSAAIDEIGRLAGREVDGAAHPIGLHLEGPALAPARRGAHDPRSITAVHELDVERWTVEAGVRMVTLAPELPGALALIERLVRAGVVVSAGHTDCTAAEFVAARRAGVSMVTHLFNAMRPFNHRDPGPIGATLADPSVFAGLICDGLHVDPVAVAMAWQSLGARRTVLVTDAIAALGMPPGGATLGSVGVTVDETGVRTAAGVLAGSNLALDQAIRNLVDFTGCSVGEAIVAASTTPGRLLGLGDRGTITSGSRADLVVLDDELRPRYTVIGGRLAWKS